MRLGRKIMAAMAFQARSGCSDGYLFDLDGSDRFTRPRTGIDQFPTHGAGDFAKLGSLNALAPLNNAFVYGQMYGKIPYGPIMSAIPDNLQWQITLPGLTKYMPNS